MSAAIIHAARSRHLSRPRLRVRGRRARRRGGLARAPAADPRLRAGGILIGPFTPGPSVSDVHTFEVVAEIGVVLLMFSIGIEFSLSDLLRVKWIALIGGPLGIALSALLGLGGGVLGWPPLQGIVIGIVVSVASTMVLARLLIDRGELQSRHGRVMIGITLVEDLAVVVLTVLLPALGGAGARPAARHRRRAREVGARSWCRSPIWREGRADAAAARGPDRERRALPHGGAGARARHGRADPDGRALGGARRLPGRADHQQSDYAHQTLARLLPVRDTFVALFFVTIGTLIDPASVGNLPLLVAMIASRGRRQAGARALVVRLFGYPLVTALLVGVGLTQIGEFSFILVQVGEEPATSATTCTTPRWPPRC